MNDGLNPAQLDAVRALAGPLLVLAGAGTGKTRVVTHRIANLIRHGTPPERILAVTFTNKAADEMHERAAALLDGKTKARPEISTFHSLCVRVLRRHITKLGYPERFVIYDRGEQESAARRALREIRATAEQLRPSDLLYFIGRWKCASVRPAEAEQLARTDREHLAAIAYRRYQQALKTAGAVDFDDLLLCTEELFQECPDVRREEAKRFDHLLIDEYQDTNDSQYRIVKALAAGHRNLCVVGDDDQSIYGWRGAQVTHILRFKRDWPEAKVVRLEWNYRSTAAILGLANRLIALNKSRHEKVLRPVRTGGAMPRIWQCEDENAEAAKVAADIKERLAKGDAEPRDFAILLRTNEQTRPLESELRRLDLPYVLVGGMSFYDRKEVRDILAFFKLLVMPSDDASLLRIINRPPRGISQAAVGHLTRHAIGQGKPLWDVLADSKRIDGVTPAAAAAVIAFQRTIESFRERLSSQPPLAVARSLIDQIDYRQELAAQYKTEADVETRWRAVEEVVNALAGYQERVEKPTLSGFLDEIALSGRDEQDDKEAKLNRNAIVLLTLHSAKGLEFPQVYMVGMEEGFLPHRRSVKAEQDSDPGDIEEERRLCYVGVTRAKEKLTLTLALSRRKWGQLRDTEPSRFLFEMTGQADKRVAREMTRKNAKKKSRQL